jgi:ribosome-binding factor A
MNKRIKPKTNSNRGERVASAVQHHIGNILARDFSEGIIANVNISDTVAHGGLQFVKIYYYLTNGADRAAAQKALDNATPKIRFELGQIMNQKYVPDIRFEYDDTLEQAQKIEELLKNIETKE